MASKRVLSVKQKEILLAGRAIGRVIAHSRLSEQAKARWRDPVYREMMRAASTKKLTGRERPTTRKSTTKPTTGDIAWAAGFIEGEGTFKGGTSLQVCAAQVNPEPLDRMMALFGGTITDHLLGNGRVSHAKLWRVAGARGRGFAMTIYPLMSEKRKGQIRVALK